MSANQDLAHSLLETIGRSVTRRPVSHGVDEGTVSIVSNGNQLVVAGFTDGRWRKPGGCDLPIVPTHWLKWKETSNGPTK